MSNIFKKPVSARFKNNGASTFKIGSVFIRPGASADVSLALAGAATVIFQAKDEIEFVGFVVGTKLVTICDGSCCTGACTPTDPELDEEEEVTPESLAGEEPPAFGALAAMADTVIEVDIQEPSESMSRPELVELARIVGVATSGTKKDLVGRILEAKTVTNEE